MKIKWVCIKFRSLVVLFSKKSINFLNYFSAMNINLFEYILGPFVYGSMFNHCFTGSTEFWDVARKVRDSITNNRDLDLQMNGMLNFVRYLRTLNVFMLGFVVTSL